MSAPIHNGTASGREVREMEVEWCKKGLPCLWIWKNSTIVSSAQQKYKNLLYQVLMLFCTYESQNSSKEKYILWTLFCTTAYTSIILSHICFNSQAAVLLIDDRDVFQSSLFMYINLQFFYHKYNSIIFILSLPALELFLLNKILKVEFLSH